MKRADFILTAFLVSLLLSSCGAIPTLPPLDSTVTVRTPRFTGGPDLPTATGQAAPASPTVKPAESTSTPPGAPTATSKPSATAVAPSQTPVKTAIPSPTPTKTLTKTPQPTSTPRATATATPAPYRLQNMTPYYLANFTHPDLGCSWLGVAGQVFNSAGVVQKDILIKLGGTLAGAAIVEQMTMPLAEPEIDLAYGPGGYEVTLANAPAASESSVWIQLFNLEGKPLSDRIYLTTFDDCQKNLILMNFIEE